eukprot:g5304.t1
MKSNFAVFILCLVLCYASVNYAANVRTLKQSSSARASANCRAGSGGRCSSVSSVDTRATSADVSSISRALSEAVARANDGANVDASAQAFASAVATAYATIVTRFRGSVRSSGRSVGCASGSSFGQASATALADATAQAFSRSSNRNARAAADCFARAVSRAAVTVTQRASFRVCASNSQASIRSLLISRGFAQAVATAFANVYTAIRDNNAQAAATCSASSFANSGSRTRIFG